MGDPEYIEVAVDIRSQGFWGTYTYSVPREHRARVFPGCVVTVPFGSRRVRGFVLGFGVKPPGVDEVKSIEGVEDPRPAFSPVLMALAREVSVLYCSPIQLVLRAMLPPGLLSPGKRLVRLVVDRERLEAMSGGLTPEESAVVGVLAEDGERAPAELAEAAGVRGIQAVLRVLAARGIVTTETVFRTPRRQGSVLRVYPAGEISEQELARLQASAPRRADLLMLLMREGRGMTAAEAVRRSGAGQSSLKALIREGLVRVERTPRSAENVGRQDPDAPAGRDAVDPRGAPVAEALARLLERGERPTSPDSGRGGPRAALLVGGTLRDRLAVYSAVVEKTIGEGGGILLLAPEIALATRLRLGLCGRAGFESVVLHSGLSEGERYAHWKEIAEGRASIVIGTRSAVFAPVKDLRAIVVEAEQDDGFKQAEGCPRYHARDIALMRSRMEGCGAVLAASAPSVESYFGAVTGRYGLVRIPPGEGDEPPRCVSADMRRELRDGNRSLFSRLLRDEVKRALGAGGQAVLYLDRRGMATFVLCRECGFTPRCPNCDITLTLHAEGTLRCHYCGHRAPAPDLCPRCGGRRVRPFGAGTQRVEEEARSLFPSARVIRLDYDTASRRSSYESLVRTFVEGRADILVGSRMLVGCEDLPRVATVGVMSADTALHLPDFRSAERAFQLLVGMLSLARRGGSGTAVIQTYDEEHYSVRAACRNDYEAFFEREIEARRELRYPPFGHLVNVIVWGKSEATARALSKDAARLLEKDAPGRYEVFGPVAAPFSRLRGWFRWQVLMKGPGGKEMSEAARNVTEALDRKVRATGSRLTIDVDPVSTL
ncbi:MAG: primosomal protein N' [Firmicutes bacterium]|nr:primosomal protein N' [Bacillota bacterium]